MARKPGSGDWANADFRRAVELGDLYTVRWHLSKGIKVDSKDKKGRSAVHWAALNNQPEVLKVLIAAGADLKSRKGDLGLAAHLYPAIADVLKQVASERRGPLINAVQSGDLDAVRAHLAAEADVKHTDGNGLTALHWAADEGRTDIVKELIKAGANVNSRHKQLSPLNLAALRNHADTVAELIRAGADVDYRGPDGLTALGLAEEWGHAETAKILREAGATVRGERKKSRGR